MAMTEATHNIMWIRNVLNELRIPQRCTLVHQNNVRAINWITVEPAKNMSHRRHVYMRHICVMDQVKRDTIDVTEVFRDDMEAMLLSKTLPPYGFERELNWALFFN